MQNDKVSILVVEDNKESLQYLTDILRQHNYHVRPIRNGTQALKSIKAKLPDIILLDIKMPPDMDGYEVCKALKADENTQHIPVIFISGLISIKEKTKGFACGGVDYITKPFLNEEVLARVKLHVENAQLLQQLQEKNNALQQTIERLENEKKEKQATQQALQKADEKISLISAQQAKRWGMNQLIGKSAAILQVMKKVEKLSGTNTNVLILGESGTGKELLARAIHYRENSREPFVAVNCSLFTKDIAQAQLFGHTRGAFTSAVDSHKGFFECADGGTLFLDEIGDLSLEVQTMLLRTLEDGVIRPVGSEVNRKINVRIIAATNNDLQHKMNAGLFRSDLYFRLARFILHVPSLRERREDIAPIVLHFVANLCEEMGREKPAVDPRAMSLLTNYNYRGNIRELKNIVEHAIIMCNGKIIAVEDLPHHIALVNDSSPQNNQEESEEQTILDYVAKHGRISNSECRDLLNTDLHHASYMLRKLQQAEVLIRKGQRRWSYYCLP